MEPKTRATVSLIVLILLIGCLVGLLLLRAIESRNINTEPDSDVDRLSGSELRWMMNSAKYSPGAVSGYIEAHPDFAWLFDGSFVDYIRN